MRGFGGSAPDDGRKAALPITVGIVVWLVSGLVATGTPYDLRVLTVAGIYALGALGYQLIFGFAGALSLAQGSFFGLGAYVTAILGTRYGLDGAATLPLAMLVPTALALVVSLPVMRLQSHYVALATLGIGQVVSLVAIHWISVTGGSNGLAGVPGFAVFGFAVPRGVPLCLVVWALVGLGVLGAAWLGRGRRGLVLAQMRADPVVARSLGIDTTRLGVGLFLASAAYGGAAGALMAHTQHVVSPAAVGFGMMVSFLTMCVVGGRGRIAGAVLGAVLLVHLPEWLRGFAEAERLLYGLGLLAAIVLAPEGLVGLIEAAGARLVGGRRAPGERARPAPAAPLPAAAAAPAPLVVERLSRRYGGIRAVDDLSLTIAPGSLVGVIGPNGSGKTTLVNLITGLAEPDAGVVRLGDRRLSGRAPERIARLGVARSFQAGGLPGGLTAAEAVVVALASGTPARVARACLDRVGAGEVAEVPCAALPAGARRRVELARLLARAPRVLLLDEPAAGLDADERARLAELLVAERRQGRSLVVVEHDVPFLAAIADRVICLDRGRLVFDGPAAAVAADPAVRAAYLGCAP